MIAVEITQAIPKKASSPATLNMPIPTPARLPFSAVSAWASRSVGADQLGDLLGEVVDEGAQGWIVADRVPRAAGGRRTHVRPVPTRPGGIRPSGVGGRP